MNEFWNALSSIAGAIATIIAALIAALCAFRVSSIDNRDKVLRSVWAFEEYLKALSAYIEIQTPENKANYSSAYALFYFYSGSLKEDIKSINQEVVAGEFIKIDEKKFDLINKYCSLYDMEKFSLKKRHKA